MRGVAAACVTAASCGVFALASCTTTLSYVREDAGKDGAAGDAGKADAAIEAGLSSTTCRRFLLVGGSTKDAGQRSAAYYGDIFPSQKEVNWTEIQLPTLSYETSEAAAVDLGDGRALTAGGYLRRTNAATFDGIVWRREDMTAGGGGQCTAGVLLPSTVHVLCNQRDTGTAGTAAYGTFQERQPIRWVDIAASPSQAPGSAIAVAKGRFVVIAQSGTVDVGSPSKTTPGLLDWKVQPTTSTPGRNNACAVGAGNALFLIGGNGDPSVKVARVGPEGSIDWQDSLSQPNLPSPLARAACIFANNRVWVIGGDTGNNAFASTVHSALVNGEQLTGWETAAAPLPAPLANAAVACLP